MEKLLQIQGELKAPKNQYNKFGKYKYRSQEDILEAVKPLLQKYKCLLTLTDEVKSAGDMVYIESTARLTDYNETKEVKASAGVEHQKGMAMAQSFGSSSSYARKYALNGLFLIDDTKDADATNKHEDSTSGNAKKQLQYLLDKQTDYQTLDEKKIEIRDEYVSMGLDKREVTDMVAKKLEELNENS